MTRHQLRRWFFDLHYIVGRTPWDTGVTPPEVVELAGAVCGRALDLGCGTGTNAVYLARHGWEVVGVDFSAVAIRRARRRAQRAGAACRFYRADASDLGFLTEPFDLVLDIGCLHGLPPERRRRYAVEVGRLVRPGGLYLLYAFTPPLHGPVARGLSPQMVHDLFSPDFLVEGQQVGEDPSGAGSAWYWLRRRPVDNRSGVFSLYVGRGDERY